MFRGLQEENKGGQEMPGVLVIFPTICIQVEMLSFRWTRIEQKSITQNAISGIIPKECKCNYIEFRIESIHQSFPVDNDTELLCPPSGNCAGN